MLSVRHSVKGKSIYQAAMTRVGSTVLVKAGLLSSHWQQFFPSQQTAIAQAIQLRTLLIPLPISWTTGFSYAD